MAVPKKKFPKFDRTIAEELFNQWRRLYRKGDSTEIAKNLKVSKPTIDKAVIYGHVHQQRIVDYITSYFADRIMRERHDGDRLKTLQDTRQGAIAFTVEA